MANRFRRIWLGWLICLGTAQVEAQPPSADFRLRIDSFGLAKQPIYSEDAVVRSGRIYVIATNTKEVTIIEPDQARIEILDIGRRIQTEVTYQALDESIVKIKASLRASAEALEKQGGRARMVEAKMARDLFETKLEPTFDTRTNRLRLVNPAVEIDTEAEPEADATRLRFVTETLVNIARIGAYRAPNDLPPFVELETLAALSGDRKLRPTSITYLYRLAGPPQKIRRTYKLTPSLTEREVEAISRIDKLREVAPTVRYEKYRVDR